MRKKKNKLSKSPGGSTDEPDKYDVLQKAIFLQMVAKKDKKGNQLSVEVAEKLYWVIATLQKLQDAVKREGKEASVATYHAAVAAVQIFDVYGSTHLKAKAYLYSKWPTFYFADIDQRKAREKYHKSLRLGRHSIPKPRTKPTSGLRPYVRLALWAYNWVDESVHSTNFDAQSLFRDLLSLSNEQKKQSERYIRLVFAIRLAVKVDSLDVIPEEKRETASENDIKNYWWEAGKLALRAHFPDLEKEKCFDVDRKQWPEGEERTKLEGRVKEFFNRFWPKLEKQKQSKGKSPI